MAGVNRSDGFDRESKYLRFEHIDHTVITFLSVGQDLALYSGVICLLCCSRSLSLGLAGDGPLEIFSEALDTPYQLQIGKDKTTRQQRVRRRSGGD